ncbi:MAG: sensor histidine kinase [Aulosira sp. DedQUE10]|nr:sensor histidine kinase [Aulosira sp. DedQUE10]
MEELHTPEQLSQMHQQLWQCVLEFANLSAAQERKRIARDLHDSLGHALTALNFQLQTASKLCKPDPNQAQEFLNEANRLMAIATQEVRQSVKALRSDPIAGKSLETLIASLVHDFHQTTGIVPEVEINLAIALLPHFTAPLYRIIQEALNNIRKYAQATAVRINVCTTSNGVYLTIQDNGRGFDVQKVSGGYGLRGMQERIAVLQGHFELAAQPGAGCCITVEIPLQISNIREINPNIREIPQISAISNISLISEISIPQDSIAINQRQPVTIGEWQPLNLNEWLA